MYRKTNLRLLNLVLLLALLLPAGMTAQAAAPPRPAQFDCGNVTEIPQVECEALVALYESTDGDNWNHNTDWLATNTPCSWYGVTCEAEHVTMLKLPGNNAQGALPAEIGELTALRYIDLGERYIYGEGLKWNSLTALPPEIGNLKQLTHLDLQFNHLTSLPTEIGGLSALTRLELRFSYIATLPEEIGNLSALTHLDLYAGDLITLPTEIGNLSSLTTLDLGYNDLITLPSEVGNLTNLTRFVINHNQLAGPIPSWIGNLVALQYLDLSRNQFTGPVPSRIGDLSALTYFYLDNNQLTALPAEIGNLTALEWLRLNDNQLTALPAEAGSLTALTELHLNDNQLSGSIPTEMGNFTALKRLYLHDNSFDGEVPSILTALTQLDRFTFYDTDLCVPSDGEVPTWLAGIDEVYGTGQVCGQSAGSLQGTVTQPDTTPAAGIQVNLYRPIERGRWHYVTSVHPTAAGAYQFDGLGQGIDYRVQFVDPAHTYAPEYYDDQNTLDLAMPVTVTIGMTRTGIDAVLDAPHPPVAAIETGGGSVTYHPNDGTATVNMVRSRTDDITVTRAVTCASGAPSTVTLTLDPPGNVYSMTLVSGDDYQATIPGADITQDADLVVAATCGISTTETTVGHVNLYDPSGVISDAVSGQPVEAATVTLYNVPGWEPKTGPDDDRPNTCQSNDSKDPGEPWDQPAPTDLGVIVNPEVTTVEPSLSYQHTDNAGAYGWDVWDMSEGCWYVEVTAEGYDSLTSPVVGVPPKVTDLNLSLMPTDFKVDLLKAATPTLTITNGSTITYTLAVSASADITLHIYDALDPNLRWQGFVGDVPETLTYTTALTGTVALSATTPLTVTFAAEVDLPPASFVNEYAQVSNTAYYYLPGETLMMMRPSNPVTRTIYDKAAFEIFLPLVVRES